MKEMIRRFIIIGAAVIVMAMPAVTHAEDGMTSGDDETTSSDSTDPSGSTDDTVADDSSNLEQKFRRQVQARLQKLKDEREAKMTESEAHLNERLDAAKKKACENHLATINRLMTNMNSRGQGFYDRITKIATAVKDYYVSKNLSVSNYNELAAAVDATQSVAQSALSAQVAIPSLDCSGDHPRADAAGFKENHQQTVDAMKAYRDAVKNLVKAVRAAASALAEGTSNAQ